MWPIWNLYDWNCDDFRLYTHGENREHAKHMLTHEHKNTILREKQDKKCLFISFRKEKLPIIATITTNLSYLLSII